MCVCMSMHMCVYVCVYVCVCLSVPVSVCVCQCVQDIVLVESMTEYLWEEKRISSAHEGYLTHHNTIQNKQKTQLLTLL